MPLSDPPRCMRHWSSNSRFNPVEENRPLQLIRVVASLGFLAAFASAQMPMPRAGYRFPIGQTLTYDVDWRLLSAGTATLKVEPAGTNVRVVGTGDSIGAIALLYHVHDRFESLVDPTNYCSLSLSKQTEEGFRRITTNISYDYSRSLSVLSEKNLKNNQSKRQENAIPGCVSDVLSSIFYVGSLPLAPGATYTFPINDGGKTSVVDLKVEGKEDIKTAAGTYHTIRVQPQTQNAPVKNKGQIWLWFSDDERHLPVQMRARLFWGTLTLKLAKAETK